MRAVIWWHHIVTKNSPPVVQAVATRPPAGSQAIQAGQTDVQSMLGERERESGFWDLQNAKIGNENKRFPLLLSRQIK